MRNALLASLLLCSAGACIHASVLTAYLSAPAVVATQVTGAVTEDFNSTSLLTQHSGGTDTGGVHTFNWTNGANLIGTYTAVAPTGAYIPIIAADQYGGAGGSPNQYMYVGKRNTNDATTVELDLQTPENYFGFWWSAGDPLNVLQIYSGSVLVATFTTADLTSFLGTSSSQNTITAISGAKYGPGGTGTYFGNPTSAFHAQDGSEPFAYVNLVASGFSFDRIVFTNNGSSGFENDNNSVYAGTLDIPDNYTAWAFVENVPVNTPEPGPMGLVAAAVAGGLAVRRRNRRA